MTRNDLYKTSYSAFLLSAVFINDFQEGLCPTVLPGGSSGAPTLGCFGGHFGPCFLGILPICPSMARGALQSSRPLGLISNSGKWL